MIDFRSETVLKRDIFSETHKGCLGGDRTAPVIRRIVSAAPWWNRPLAWMLAKREIRALHAVADVDGTPRLIATDRDGLYRTWTEGTPLHLARPTNRGFYRDAHRILRALRAVKVTHNDLAKPQNWLMTNDGRAAVIDFQLASRHRSRGLLFRIMAYEDFRHLLKQQRAFAPGSLTPTGRRLLAKRSWPSRLWRATGKRVYNLVTRGLFRWSDGEGTGDRIDNEGAGIIATLRALPGVTDVALATYPFPRKGVGLYAFVETAAGFDEQALLRHDTTADLVQRVEHLPRGRTGTPRIDVLALIAMNRMQELDDLLAVEPDLAAIVVPIAAGRLNLTDRRIARLEG